MSFTLPRTGATRPPSRGIGGAAFLFIATLSGNALADHCMWRFAAGFQRTANQSLSGMKQEQVVRTVEETFGPRQAVCEEAAYRFFVTEFSTYAASAFHNKGSERDAMLLAAQEILKRVPSQVFFKNTQAKTSAYQQLRSDLGAVAREVGLTPGVQSLLDAVDRLGPPAISSKPERMNDAAVQIKVPAPPLPPWAVISLYEIYDHASRKENGAVMTKTALILEWMKLVTTGTSPADISVVPVARAK